MGVELLTGAEHRFMALTAELWNLLAREIVEDGPSREGDLEEMAGHFHTIQERILAQAGARAYPGLYRVLGGSIAGSEVTR